MDNQNPLNQGSQNQNEEAEFDFKKFLTKIVSNWPLFVIGIIIFGCAAGFYKRYAVSDYKIHAMMLIDDDKGASSSSSAMGGLGALTDISSLLGVTSNAENEVNILKSRSVITNAVKDLKLNIIVYRNGRIKKTELFDEAPFEVRLIYKTDSLLARKYNISIVNNSIHVTNSKEDIDLKASFNQKISLPQYDLFLIPKQKPIDEHGYTIVITSIESAVENLSKALDVSLSSKTTTTIDLALGYTNSKKGEAILNKVMDVYLTANKANKLQIADSTLLFINQRLDLVGKELSGVEKQFEQFRKQNKIADVEEQSKALIGASSDFQKQLSTLDVQLSVAQDLQKFLSNPANKKVIPSTLGVDVDGFSETVQRYNELLLEKDRQSIASTDNNPYVQTLDTQIESLHGIILKNLNTYVKSLLVSKGNLQGQNSKFNGQIESVPAISRQFLDYTRQQTVKQDLYIFLLQKREETAISKTSTISNARIIDVAKSEYEPNKSKSTLIALVLLAMGFLVPLAFIYIRELFNVTISYKSDVEDGTKIPIVGEVSHNESQNSLVVNNQSRSIISEQFRALRTNLQYLLNSDTPQVIMVTSSMSGEGKSFI